MEIIFCPYCNKKIGDNLNLIYCDSCKSLFKNNSYVLHIMKQYSKTINSLIGYSNCYMYMFSGDHFYNNINTYYDKENNEKFSTYKCEFCDHVYLERNYECIEKM